MSALSEELDRYLSIRRGLGHDLRTAERILRRFIAFMDQQGDSHITANLFLRWQDTTGAACRQTRLGQLVAVRPFAAWLHGMDPAHEILPSSLLPGHRHRPQPYIYSGDEIGVRQRFLHFWATKLNSHASSEKRSFFWYRSLLFPTNPMGAVLTPVAIP